MYEYLLSAVMAFIGVLIGAFIRRLDTNGDGKVDADEIYAAIYNAISDSAVFEYVADDETESVDDDERE